MKCLLYLTIPALLFPAGVSGQTTEERLAIWLKKFPEADTNEDGKLTEEEARAYRDKIKSGEKGDDRKRKKKVRVEPTHADVPYGEHERHRFDVWLPEKPSTDGLPYPLLVFYHGGGFVAGDKGSFDPAKYLAEGIACASVNYRFVDGENSLSPIPLHDSARALQTILSRATEWNLDSGRVALSGGSAGAVISLWIGYHDDLAEPESEDPIARISTRVTCLLPINGPTNLMPDWILENVGGPKHVHGSFVKLFGEGVTIPVSDSLRAKVAEMSPWEFVSKDDPPTYLIYSGPLDETPLPESVSTGKSIHHPAFGKLLKEKLDALGVENEFRHGFDPRGTPDLIDYLKNKFGMVD